MLLIHSGEKNEVLFHTKVFLRSDNHQIDDCNDVSVDLKFYWKSEYLTPEY